MPLLTTGAGVYKAAAVAPASSVWGDHGTNVALSTTTIANDTATGTAGSLSSVRGTQARSSGKYYFEVKLLTAPGAPIFNIGIMDDATANGADMDAGLLINSAGHTMYNGNQQSNGWNATALGDGFTLADGDVMGIAVDFDGDVEAGYSFGYLHKNNTYFLGGVPTSGPLGTGATYNGAFPGARPMVSLWNVGTVAQLITSASSLLYLPSGYTAWG